MRRRTKQLPY